MGDVAMSSTSILPLETFLSMYQSTDTNRSSPGTEDKIDVGLLWQFGLALIAGVFLFGLPCTCLLSWWARRHMRMHSINEVDPGVFHRISQAQNGRQLVKEADMNLFPIRTYHPKHFRRQPPIHAESSVKISSNIPATASADGAESIATALETETSPDGFGRTGESTATLFVVDIDTPTSSFCVDDMSVKSATPSLAYCIDTCPICLENFEEGEPVRELLPCQHYFHGPCIEPWVTQRKGICPLCRSDVSLLIQDQTEWDQTHVESHQNQTARPESPHSEIDLSDLHTSAQTQQLEAHADLLRRLMEYTTQR
ncbi:hypothetical protein DFS34DRAFT_619322 [Phlyctochytrium arcticum]|nr:hypothetical protein DFS34DRAFT_619322 [Phlyctochytrium arcticum]